MKRVGFVFESPPKKWSWLGGYQYYRNLISSFVEACPDWQVVIFGPSHTKPEDYGLNAHEFVFSEVLLPGHRGRLVTKSKTGRDDPLIDLLRKNKIKILSHHLGNADFPG